jgi:hypothetical protein
MRFVATETLEQQSDLVLYSPADRSDLANGKTCRVLLSTALLIY